MCSKGMRGADVVVVGGEIVEVLRVLVGSVRVRTIVRKVAGGGLLSVGDHERCRSSRVSVAAL